MMYTSKRKTRDEDDGEHHPTCLTGEGGGGGGGARVLDNNTKSRVVLSNEIQFPLMGNISLFVAPYITMKGL